MKIITNTASSLTQEEGKKLGISIIPVSVLLGGRSLRDYTDITSDEYVKLLHGDDACILPAFSRRYAAGAGGHRRGCDHADCRRRSLENTLYCYESAEKDCPTETTFVINSCLLAGPLRYMAVKAAGLRDRGISTKEIVSRSGHAPGRPYLM